MLHNLYNNPTPKVLTHTVTCHMVVCVLSTQQPASPMNSRSTHILCKQWTFFCLRNLVKQNATASFSTAVSDFHGQEFKLCAPTIFRAFLLTSMCLNQLIYFVFQVAIGLNGLKGGKLFSYRQIPEVP